MVPDGLRPSLFVVALLVAVAVSGCVVDVRWTTPTPTDDAAVTGTPTTPDTPTPTANETTTPAEPTAAPI